MSNRVIHQHDNEDDGPFKTTTQGVMKDDLVLDSTVAAQNLEYKMSNILDKPQSDLSCSVLSRATCSSESSRSLS